MQARDVSTWPNHRFSRFIDAAGIRWHVQQGGAGPALMLVHGTGASTHTWRDVLPALAINYHVTAVDLPGHGATNAIPAAGQSIEGMSRALGALLRALGVQPQYCVGHSAGAVILCRMALDGEIAPRMIVSINGAFVPLGGVAGVLFSPLAKFLARSAVLPRLLAARAGRPSNVARMLAGTGSSLDGAGVEFYSRLIRDPKHVAGALGMMSQWDLPAFYGHLPSLRTPLALLAGANDRTVPAQQAFEVQKRVPHASVRVLPNLGHLAHEEQPQRLVEEIEAALRQRGC